MSSSVVKKMTMEEQKKVFDELLKQSDNRNCADCAAKGPRWASTNLGVFVCIRCSGIHRNLGVHISKVKSTTLDQWPVDMVQNMQEIGNAKANAYWEARVPPSYHRPSEHSDTYTTEQFIRAKYERKEFVSLDESLNPYVKGDTKKPKKKTEEAREEPAPAKSSSSSKAHSVAPVSAKKEKAPGKKAEAVPDLLDFGEDTSIPRKASFGASDPFAPTQRATPAPAAATADPFADFFGATTAPPPGVAIQQDFLTAPIAPAAPGTAPPASKESILSLFNSTSPSNIIQPTTASTSNVTRGPPPLASQQPLPSGPNYNIDLRSAVAQSSGRPVPPQGYPNYPGNPAARGFGGPQQGGFGGPQQGGFGGPQQGGFGGGNPGMGGFGGPQQGGFGGPQQGGFGGPQQGGFGGGNPGMGGFGGPQQGGFGGPQQGGFGGPQQGGFGGPQQGGFGGPQQGGFGGGATPYVNQAFVQQQQQRPPFQQSGVGFGGPQGGFGGSQPGGFNQGQQGQGFNLF